MSLSAATAQTPKTDDEKALYALGALLARNALGTFNVTPAELEIVKAGMTDQLTGAKLKIDGPLESYQEKLPKLAAARGEQASQAFLKKAGAEKGAVVKESGLIFTSVKPGKGASPKKTDTVKVHYRGTLPNGAEFDSSYKRNEPAEFPLDRVIPCWTEGLQLMSPGGKAKLVCPAKIAYGERGSPGGIPPNAALQFEVELISVKSAPAADAGK